MPVQAIVDAAVGERSGTVTTKGNPNGTQAAVSPGAVPAGGDGTAAASVAVPADIRPKKCNLWFKSDRKSHVKLTVTSAG